MHPCFYLLFNLIIGFALFYTHYDSSKDYIDIQSPPNVVCINEDGLSNTFCAQCVTKSEDIDSSKGYLVKTQGKASILKIKSSSKELSCKDYLQFPNFQKMKVVNTNTLLEIDDINSIHQILKDVGGVLSVSTKELQFVESQYKEFVIYRWFDASKQKGSIIKAPNPLQVKNLQQTFLYVANGIILLFITLYFYDKSTFSHLKPKILISASIYFVLIEVLTLNILPEGTIIVWTRVAFLTILLMRIDTNKLIIAISLLLGFSQIYMPLLFIPYILFVFIALLVRGYNEQNTKQIWTYIIFSMIVYIVNHIVWTLLFAERADTQSRLVELSILVLTPLGLMLIKDAKYVGFDIYKPSDQKKHTISLSGFEEQDEDEESGV